MVSVVVAPDSFKGSAEAAEVAEAIAEGWRSVRPHDDVRLMPMADGGEGTLDAFEVAVPGSRRMPISVTGPDGRTVDASWLLVPPRADAPNGIGVVELAATSGLTLLDPLLPFEAHTLGFGEAIAGALDHGVSRVYLGIGGSSSTDGGAGALVALGARFVDAAGADIPFGNRGLAELAAVDLSGLRALPPAGAVVLSDVTNPLLGARGAAAIFGPQKGAAPDDIALLDASLARFAGLVQQDPAAPGAGAAGGAGFGLLLWGATLQAGSEAVAAALGIPAVLAEADVLITGEGRFDEQSAAGKVAAYLADLAAVNDARAYLVAGSIEASTEQFAAAESLTVIAGSSSVAMAEPVPALRSAGQRLAREFESTAK